MTTPPTSRRFLTLRFLALAAVAVGGGLAFRTAPKVTLTNAGLLFAYAPLAPLGALLGATGAAALFALAGRWTARGVAGLLGVGLLAWSAERALFRLEVGAERLSLRGLSGTRSLAWIEVQRVDAPPDAMILEGRGGQVVTVSTRAFLPEQRHSLERAVARQIAGTQMPKLPAGTPEPGPR